MMLGSACRPVDFVAEGIAGVASAQRTGCGLYHVVNPHWEDNVSLDSFLGWIENAGYPLKRIDDYTQWYAFLSFPAVLEMSYNIHPSPHVGRLHTGFKACR